MDEVCGWVVFHKLKTAGVTAKMEMRYRKPVSTLQRYVKLRGRLLELRRNVATVEGELLSEEGELLCSCVCTYFTFPQDKARSEMGYIASTTGEEDITYEDLINSL